ncbi:hypothetical protein P171DRAFT_490772 [Karstenula rhodostoma CBS 690.94]|uniref:Uncharacterized protein n=1 Tax=Karstenula rhodostoma CBS 690.94 TaxID=1392251 RepID=A0A9P4P8C3_9PLEO|nr:hypothetical protein P171DRAFT_490772 [Karstenula rhodostoma CBS 690.94]
MAYRNGGSQPAIDKRGRSQCARMYPKPPEPLGLAWWYVSLRCILPHSNVFETELRNLIYFFADEGAHEIAGGHLPLLVRRGTKQWPIEDYTRSSRKYYGLTQVCRQVRAEYFPIWKRTSSVRISFDDFASFVTSFYGDEHNAYGPGLLQLSFKRPSLGIPVQLYHFAEFRIAHPNTEIQFVSHELINWPRTYGSKPRRRLRSTTTYSGFNCRTCGHRYGGPGSSMCVHQYNTFRLGRGNIASRYGYLQEFNRIVNHNNKKFQDEVSGGSIFWIHSWRFSGSHGRIGVGITAPGPVNVCYVGTRDFPRWKGYFEEMDIRSPDFSQWLVFCNCGSKLASIDRWTRTRRIHDLISQVRDL